MSSVKSADNRGARFQDGDRVNYLGVRRLERRAEDFRIVAYSTRRQRRRVLPETNSGAADHTAVRSNTPARPRLSSPGWNHGSVTTRRPISHRTADGCRPGRTPSSSKSR